MSGIDGVQSVSNSAAAIASPVPVERLPEHRELIRAVRAMNAAEYFGEKNEVTFLMDRETRRPVVRIVDRETREVLQQMPPEYVLRLSEDIGSRE